MGVELDIINISKEDEKMLNEGILILDNVNESTFLQSLFLFIDDKEWKPTFYYIINIKQFLTIGDFLENWDLIFADIKSLELLDQEGINTLIHKLDMAISYYHLDR